ncbi:NAD(P)-binding protein [Ascodesmis nigricans]|uniref:NAD(P)-binding protein n=1 Tax=Ascodesmis nigricans TaxID=341454 RepID=A0A4S2MR97_9PEZI|nr:NAD(P)-binding protein [Ascodesmis nigricans]
MSSTPTLALPTDPRAASSTPSWLLNQSNRNTSNISPPHAPITQPTSPSPVTATDSLLTHPPNDKHVHYRVPTSGTTTPAENAIDCPPPMPIFETATSLNGKRCMTDNWWPDFSVRGKVIIVTGGARGLGFAMVEALVEGGAHVHALDLLPSPLPAFTQLQTLAPQYHGTLTYHTLDITSPLAVTFTISGIADQHNRIDGLICSAGILNEVPALTHSPETFTKTLDVNVTGTFLCCQAVAREVITRHPRGKTPIISSSLSPPPPSGASLLLIASMSGHIANRALPMCGYNASKSAILGLTRSLASEWGQYGIRVNCLSPGYVVTKMVEQGLEKEAGGGAERRRRWEAENMLGRLAGQEEFRGVAVFAMSQGSAYMTAADLRMDAGHTAW